MECSVALAPCAFHLQMRQHSILRKNSFAVPLERHRAASSATEQLRQA
jgi:hypothetical protein